MATDAGDRFVRRHNAARGSTSNTAAADISYDTAVLSEGGYSWASPEVTVDEAGLYLTIFDIGQIQQSGITDRSVGTLVPSVNTVDQTRYRATHRYLRDSGNAFHGGSIGMCILDLSASDDVKVRMPGAVGGTDAIGTYATNASHGGALQLIRMDAGNFTHVERQSNLAINITYANTTRPWLDSTGSWTQITFTNEINDDDALYGGSGGDITLKADKKYLIVYGGSFNGSSSQRQCHMVRAEIDGTNVQAASGYERNNSSNNPPMCGMYLHEVGGTNETLKFYGTTEQEDSGVSNTVNCGNFYAQVLELPDGAEWIHVDNGTTDSLTTALANNGTWYDTPLSSTFRADGDNNLSLDGANDAVQNDSGDSLPVLAIGWHRWDRDASTSGTRKDPWLQFNNNGTRVGYGIGSAFSRGQQGNDDTWQCSMTSVAALDIANTADLKLEVQDPANGVNADMGIYASTASNRHFLGFQVLNLDSLQAAAGTTYEITLSESLDMSDMNGQGQFDFRALLSQLGISEGDLRRFQRFNYDKLDEFDVDDAVSIDITAAALEVIRTMSSYMGFDDGDLSKQSYYSYINQQPITFNDSVVQTALQKLLRTLADNFEFTDITSIDIETISEVLRTLSDSFELTSGEAEMLKWFNYFKADNLDLTDHQIRTLSTLTRICSDNFELTDSVVQEIYSTLHLLRTLTDNLMLYDTVNSYVLQKLEIILGDDFTLTDSVDISALQKLIVFLHDNFELNDESKRYALKDYKISDSFSVADAVNIEAVALLGRVLSDSFELNDGDLQLLQWYSYINQEQFNVNDTVTLETAFLLVRNLIESMDLSDLVSIDIEAISETLITLTDNFELTSGESELLQWFNYNKADHFDLTDEQTRLLGVLTRICSDNVEFNDSVIQSILSTLLLFRTLTESLNLTDDKQRYVWHNYVTNDSFNFSDSVTSSIFALVTRALNDSFTLYDNLKQDRELSVLLSEQLTLADIIAIAIEGITETVITLQQSFDLTDGDLQHQQWFNYINQNSFNLTDSTVSEVIQRLKNRTLVQAFEMNDTVSIETIIQALVSRVLSDNIELTSGDAEKLQWFNYNKADSFTLEDITDLNQLIERLFTDHFEINDSVIASAVQETLRILASSFDLSDGDLQRQQWFNYINLEEINFDDSVAITTTALEEIVRILSEYVEFNETDFQRYTDHNIAAESSFDLTDNITQEILAQFLRQLSDNLALQDSVNLETLLTIFRQLASEFEINDSVSLAIQGATTILVTLADQFDVTSGDAEKLQWFNYDKSDNFELNDVVSIVVGVVSEIFRTLNQHLPFYETNLYKYTLKTILAKNNIDYTDSMSAEILGQIVRILSQYMTMNESVGTSAELTKLLDSAMDFTDNVDLAQAITLMRQLVDQIDFDDTVSSEVITIFVSRVLEEGFDFVDSTSISILIIGLINRVLTDTIEINDVIDRHSDAWRVMEDGFDLEDVSIASRLIEQIMSDNFALYSMVSQQIDVNKLLRDAYAITDEIKRDADFQRLLNENIEFQDQVVLAATYQIVRTLMDSMDIDDRVISQFIQYLTHWGFAKMLLVFAKIVMNLLKWSITFMLKQDDEFELVPSSGVMGLVLNETEIQLQDR